MTPQELEKEAERIVRDVSYGWADTELRGVARENVLNVEKILRAVHDAAIASFVVEAMDNDPRLAHANAKVWNEAIEKAAIVVEDRKKAYRVDVAADIRALKIGDGK